ncbi:hypothetical protein C1645_828566 [Glomus cerebriforme]|uniref:Uncharacterized protein n=1 Tax=Glomus cerebriforme TaxID=658196 RepID=A0A397SPT5_9GLOM|nr:hypothetical protein C1645_828566 [Glomus cerebriforme]
MPKSKQKQSRLLPYEQLNKKQATEAKKIIQTTYDIYNLRLFADKNFFIFLVLICKQLIDKYNYNKLGRFELFIQTIKSTAGFNSTFLCNDNEKDVLNKITVNFEDISLGRRTQIKTGAIITSINIEQNQCNDLQISPDDVIDVFRGGKTAKIKQKNWNTLPVYPTEKRKVLKTKDLVQFALTDLVIRDLVQEEIILQKLFEGSKSLSSSIIVIGVVPDTQANANVQTWCYFVK